MEKLSLQEEEAMQLVWKKKGGFVKELLDVLDNDQKIPYTTLASTLRNLERKGYLKAIKFANAYRYESVISEEEYKKKFMSSFVSSYFKNSYKELVSFFAKEEKISANELKDILKMIDDQ